MTPSPSAQAQASETVERCPLCSSHATAEGAIMRQGWAVSCDNIECQASTLIWDTEAEAVHAWKSGAIFK